MDQNQFLEDLKELVSIDSGTHNSAGVTKVAEVMVGKYKALGWHAELVDCGPDAGRAVFATNKPGADKFDVLMVGHMDTVFADGTATERPFRTEGNMGYGPGIADMKAGVMSMFYACKALAPEQTQRLSIAIALNPDEETGSNHSGAWIDELAKKSRYAMIIEPSRGEGGQLVKARKGMARYNFDFSGVASHAGNAPEAGRSAIHEMAHCIIALTNLADKPKGTTMSVGLVSGGEAANIVAEKASCVLDVRFWDNADYDRVAKDLEALISKSFTPDVKITMQRMAYMPAMYPSPEAEAFMKIVEQCGNAAGVKVIWAEAGGGSDGNHIAITGTPVLDGFGPTGGNFHSPKEFLELDSIAPRVDLVRRVLEAL